MMGFRPAILVLALTVVCGAAVDWASHGRGNAEAHHRPLTKINQSNVSRLGLAYSVEVGSEGQNETTPLVFDGGLYRTSRWSQVYAIGLRTDKMKWRREPGM